MKKPIDFVRAGEIYKVPENYFVINGVYLTGNLKQDSIEENCASSINLLLEEEGLYDATFNGEEGYILYLWKYSVSPEISINKGLLCNVEDLYACKHAKECFNRKANPI